MSESGFSMTDTGESYDPTVWCIWDNYDLNAPVYLFKEMGYKERVAIKGRFNYSTWLDGKYESKNCTIYFLDSTDNIIYYSHPYNGEKLFSIPKC